MGQDRQDDDPALLRVAGAITNGTPLDWEAEGAAHESLRPRIESLRLIEAVATAHRGAATSPRPEPALGGAKAADALAGTVTADSPGPLAPGSPTLSTWGPLQVLGLLGSGGFGEVYRAYDPTLQRGVVLKLRRPDASRIAGRAVDHREKFLKEARNLARVRHPNVLVVHGAHRDEGRIGIWTDLLDGKTREQGLAEQGPFGERQSDRIMIDLRRAPSAVRGAGPIDHRVKAALHRRGIGDLEVAEPKATADARQRLSDLRGSFPARTAARSGISLREIRLETPPP